MFMFRENFHCSIKEHKRLFLWIQTTETGSLIGLDDTSMIKTSHACQGYKIMYLIMIDSQTKRLILFPVNIVNSYYTIDKLKIIFNGFVYHIKFWVTTVIKSTILTFYDECGIVIMSKYYHFSHLSMDWPKEGVNFQVRSRTLNGKIIRV